MVKRWDLCWVDFDFEDKPGSKRRPALVLNNNDFIIIASKVTSQRPRAKIDYSLIDWQEAGLDKPSVVRLDKKIHLNSKDGVTKIGTLSKTDIDNIKELIKKYNISLTEGKMKDISIGIENAGSKEAYIIQLEDELRDLNKYRDYLDTTGREEVGKGGNFDSISELEDTIKETESKINEISNKLDFLNK